MSQTINLYLLSNRFITVPYVPNITVREWMNIIIPYFNHNVVNENDNTFTYKIIKTGKCINTTNLRHEKLKNLAKPEDKLFLAPNNLGSGYSDFVGNLNSSGQLVNNECYICYEDSTYKRSVTLDCLHKYCFDCIEKLSLHTDNDGKYYKECPLCKRKIYDRIDLHKQY